MEHKNSLTRNVQKSEIINTIEFASGGNYAFFLRSIVGPRPSYAPRWPRFSNLAEGDYAQCLGPLCQRDTILVMLVATLLHAAYVIFK